VSTWFDICFVVRTVVLSVDEQIIENAINNSESE
jgi:hypothetical protein